MLRVALALGVGLACVAPAAAEVVNLTGRLVDGRSFIVPDDGYGTADCLKGGENGCGRVVADSWCEAHGFAAAAHFGSVEAGEITGAVTSQANGPKPRGYLVITCRQ